MYILQTLTGSVDNYIALELRKRGHQRKQQLSRAACGVNGFQSLDHQLDMLEKYGVDKIYNEKMTGTKRNRPELEKLMERLSL